MASEKEARVAATQRQLGIRGAFANPRKVPGFENSKGLPRGKP
jgi:hypothetical protein